MRVEELTWRVCGPMHVVSFIERLKANFGEPTQLEGQDAFRWQIHVPGTAERLTDIHLCVTIEERTRRVAIWVFNPESDDRGRYFHVHCEREMTEALQALEKSLAHVLSTNAPIRAS